MQTTTNIGLKTYEANDPTDWLGEFNYNMNKIDTAVGSQNDAIDVIEETAGTAVTTANTANDTATEALTTAESKTSVNDNVASATTTYSSNKIDELISGAGGAVIDDTETSTTKTWSSNKINTEITALTEKHVRNISNPDENKFNLWSCYCAKRGNILAIYGFFTFKQAPSEASSTILTSSEDIEFYNPNGDNISIGYITKSGDTSYRKIGVIFQATSSGNIRIIFPDNFDYTQIDSSYVFHYAFTLINGN